MQTPHGHLTYCSNIHPGERWDEHFKTLQENLPSIKSQLSPNAPLALGLRLANEASIELSNPERLAEFKAWLAANDLYVFTMNGFPYGGFHATRVKDDVHTPDWTTQDRTEYTKRLFRILAQLLPDGMEGGVSTSPLSYRYWWNSAEATQQALKTATENILQVTETLIELRQTTGKIMHLDIEPEPDGILENGREFMDWYADYFLPKGIAYLQDTHPFSPEEAKEMLLTHLQLCYDVCHFAVSYEDPQTIINQLNEIGIRVGKIQISSAVKIDLRENKEAKLKAIQAFDEPVYLHQVVAKNADGSFQKYGDLPEALAADTDGQTEWRIHFHVPLFIESYGLLNSTQAAIIQTLDVQKNTPFTQHLEVETYTWGVLPADMQKPIGESIVRELEWVSEQLK
ncbi:MAG: metabolite traffic protein EboE [Spirosomataceae bacterium]